MYCTYAYILHVIIYIVHIHTQLEGTNGCMLLDNQRNTETAIGGATSGAQDDETSGTVKPEKWAKAALRSSLGNWVYIYILICIYIYIIYILNMVYDMIWHDMWCVCVCHLCNMCNIPICFVMCGMFGSSLSRYVTVCLAGVSWQAPASSDLSTTVPAQWKVKGWNVATLTSLRTLFTAQRCLAARFFCSWFLQFLSPEDLETAVLILGNKCIYVECGGFIAKLSARPMQLHVCEYPLLPPTLRIKFLQVTVRQNLHIINPWLCPCGICTWHCITAAIVYEQAQKDGMKIYTCGPPFAHKSMIYS